jgi:putative ATP-dependent endonuclease of the OLD family
MKLKAVTITNFRCYKSPICLTFEDLTTLIGRNDAGKSSLLDALDIFFNDKPLDKNDASKGGDAKAVTITCTFENLPKQLLLDETSLTDLSSEFLLNADGELEITKIYNCSIEKPKLSKLSIRAEHPADELAKDLLMLKLDELKTRATEIAADLTGINKTVKREIRNAIRVKVQSKPVASLDLVLIGVEADEKGNAAKVWEGLKASLPLFALFKSDRQSSDQDAEAQDPLKIAIKEAIAAKAIELQAVMEFVETEVKKVADLTLAKLKEMDADIAATLDPKFEKPNWASLIRASITGDNEIPLNKRGSGVRRLILLNFFRAKAERAMRERQAQSTIYAVEEPETSQHPHNQRMLMRALQQLAVGNDQVIVTTHTPMLARSVPSTCLRFLSKMADGTRRILVGGTDEVNAEIAQSLGVLPDHGVKVFVIVEGVYDVVFLKSLSRMFRKHGRIVPDLDDLELSGELIFVPAGGAHNLAYWASKLKHLDRPEFHLFDRDAPSASPSKHQEKIDAVNLRPKCKAISTTRLEMENFLHHHAINVAAQAQGIQINLAAPYKFDDDIPLLLTTALNLHAPQDSKWGQSRVKFWLADKVVETMDAQMVLEVDPSGEMIGWLSAISSMLHPPEVSAVG